MATFRDDNIEDSFVADLVGLPVGASRKKKKTERFNTDPTSFGGDVGTFQTKKEIGLSKEGMKDPTSALSKQFFKLRPKKKKAGLSATSGAGEEAGLPALRTSEGRILTPGVRKQIAEESGSEVSESQRRKKGLGEFSGGGGGGGFGLPTDRLPTIEELGGAMGNIARYVSQLTKRNRARGLEPGYDIAKVKGKGSTSGLTAKDTATILAKRLEDFSLSDDERTTIKARLDAILQGRDAGAFDETRKSDIAQIIGS
jgi:hypothetical protein